MTALQRGYPVHLELLGIAAIAEYISDKAECNKTNEAFAMSTTSSLGRHGPVPGESNAVEWETRCDLTACYRLVDHYGWSDLFGTHISLRVPGTEHFLLNPYGMLFGEITASSLIKVDEGGYIVGESDFPINPAGFTIHSAVHLSSDVMNAVLHTHTPAGNAVSCMKDGLLPSNQKALLILGTVAYHD
jgi:ribulose-5-phosphate 4-epimerase/fuculose-1-phosphate aldolase